MGLEGARVAELESRVAKLEARLDMARQSKAESRSSEEKQQRVQEGSLRFKMKSEQTSQRMLSALLGAQGNLMVKAVLTAWREALGDLRQQNDLERLRDENLTMKMKSDEGARRMPSALLRSQDGLLVKEVFAVWREVLDDLRQQNELERPRGENSTMNIKSDEGTQLMLSALLRSQGGLLETMCSLPGGRCWPTCGRRRNCNGCARRTFGSS